MGMKKRILFFVESLSGGGAEKVLYDIVKHINHEVYELFVITLTDGGVYDDKIKEYCNYKTVLKKQNYKKGGIHKLIYWTKLHLIYALPAKLVYKWIIQDKNIDISIAFIEGFATKIISKSKNKKIAWVHVDPIERDYADEYYSSLKQHRKAYDTFDKIICVSKSVMNSFILKFDIKDTVTYIYNPVDQENIRKNITTTETIPNKIRILSVGRLEYQKGYDRLINALKVFPKEIYELIILGEGSERSRLESMIKNNRLEQNIFLKGFQSNPYQYMANCDLFVCSSRAEGFSLVILEAMCLSVPILTTECSGPNELVENGKYGIMVKNSVEGLIEGLNTIMNNKDTLFVLSNKSLIRSKQFSLTNAMAEIEKEIGSVIK